MFKLLFVLAFVWLLLTNQFTLVNFALGVVLGLGALWLTQRDLFEIVRLPDPRRVVRRTVRTMDLLIFFLREMLLANVRLLVAVLRPQMRLRPAVIAVPVQARTPTELTLLSNMITLTPGTLSLDIAPDQSVLYVHTMHIDDVETFRRDLQEGFYSRIQEVFR